MMKLFTKILSLTLIAMMLVLALVACAPAKEPADAKAALEENKYKVTKIDADGNLLEKGALGLMDAAGIDDIDSVVIGEKDGEKVTIIYFKDADTAKAELDDVKDYAGDVEVKQSGNMIYYGTEAGIKAAR